MDVVLLWGPERIVPEIERLRALQPGLADADLRSALDEAHAVLAEAEALAPGIKSGEIHDAGKRLSERWPWLTDSQIASAIQQGLVFHWRDTGI